MKQSLVGIRTPKSKITFLEKAKHQFKAKHILKGTEFSRSELRLLLNHAQILKAERRSRILRSSLRGRSMALLLEKPSLRTKFSFSVAMQELGGQVIESSAGQRKNETPEDTARVLAGYCHVIVVRTFDQAILERMAKVSQVPIVNALSDDHHPCQILADLLSLEERFGGLQGLRVTYVGDGNNILHSMLLLMPAMGINLCYACPKDFQPDPGVVAEAHDIAKSGGGQINAFCDPKEAVEGTNAIYTDVWTSMGFEAGAANKEDAFWEFQVNEDLYSLAHPDAAIMHCMPMVRDKEISAAMAEHKNAMLFLQSENRLHVQKALLELLKI